MKADLKKAILTSLAKEPGLPCMVYVQYSPASLAAMVKYLFEEWQILNTWGDAITPDVLTFETHQARAAIILTELRHKYPKGYLQGWSAVKCSQPDP